MGYSCPSEHGIALIIINKMLLGMGVGLIIVGSLVVTDGSNTDHVRQVLNSITVTIGSSTVGSLVNTLSILMIVTGVAIFVVTWFSLLGIIFQKRFLLITYAIIVLLLLIPQITVISLWNKTEKESRDKDKMIEALNRGYTKDKIINSNPLSRSWNFMFMTHSCCGVNPVLTTTNDFDNTPWCTTEGSCQATSSQIPRACCINITESTYNSAPTSCHASVNPGTYHLKGCYDVIKKKMLPLTPSTNGVIVTTILLQIVAGTFALWYSYQFKKI